MDYEVAGGFVVREKKLLLVEEDSGKLNVPSAISEPGELSSDTALRAVEEVTGAECEVHKYKSRMKMEYVRDDTEYSWKPYAVKMDEDAEIENGQWIPVKEIKDHDLAEQLEETVAEVIKRM